jgi:hypothetical protein
MVQIRCFLLSLPLVVGVVLMAAGQPLVMVVLVVGEVLFRRTLADRETLLLQALLKAITAERVPASALLLELVVVVGLLRLEQTGHLLLAVTEAQEQHLAYLAHQ